MDLPSPGGYGGRMWRGGLAGAVLALVVLGCGGRDLAPYQAAIDQLGLPPTWHIAQTTTQSQGGQGGCVELINGTCPSVTRYYVVVGALPDVLQTANIAVAAEGFGGIDVTHPACDLVSSTRREVEMSRSPHRRVAGRSRTDSCPLGAA